MKLKKINPNYIFTRYKYVINQTPARKNLKNSIDSWLEKKAFFSNKGGRALFVSPIFLYKNPVKETIDLLIQPHLDLDISEEELTLSQLKAIRKICKIHNLYPVYTGKHSFQLFGRRLFYHRGIISHKEIINLVLEKLKYPNKFFDSYDIMVDISNSTTNQPNPRIGWRADTENFIIPFLDLDLLVPEVLVKLYNGEIEPRKIMNVEQYLKNLICPINDIETI